VEPRYIVSWISIYFEISSSSLLQVALVDPVVYFRCTAPIDPVVGESPKSQKLVSEHTNCFATIGISAR